MISMASALLSFELIYFRQLSILVLYLGYELMRFIDPIVLLRNMNKDVRYFIN